MVNCAFAERDWEYWSQESFAIPINKKVNLMILPEWRFKKDMSDQYLFKLETGPTFKINQYLDITPYYVYQEKRTVGLWDRSDIAYLDGMVKASLKNLFDIKISNRLRYQYDFDKAKTIWRDSIKISKGYKMGKIEMAPYFSEEPFYDAKLDKITEHRTAAGFTFNLSKDISIGVGYMLNSKNAKPKWTYANVLVSNLNIKF